LRRAWLLVARVEDFFGMAPRTAALPAEFPGRKKNISNSIRLCRCSVAETRGSLRDPSGCTLVRECC
jgi:hypothetical protein